jgi:hypothetical protein
MAIHIGTRRSAILAASCLVALKRASLEQSVMRHRTRAGLVAWTGLAAGAVVAGAMLGSPVQTVGRTAHMCLGRTVAIVGIPRDAILIGTRPRGFIPDLRADDRIEGRGGSHLICGNSRADRLVGWL